MNYNELVATKIKNIREQHDYSAEQVAHSIGKSKGAYSNLENGKVEVNINTLQKLSELYEIPITHFLPDSPSIVQISNGDGYNIYQNQNIYMSDKSVVEVLEKAIGLLNKVHGQFRSNK